MEFINELAKLDWISGESIGCFLLPMVIFELTIRSPKQRSYWTSTALS
jgi:hypothetical protein